ncbi:thioredoxin-like domain-containing protein [Echria macrotheca]|uniref:Protein disulfide-isomerase n=1 Tax=Echria macrotheca TaxID=438768 RepID=A0AAJ0FDA4_9PEZI|nr:thioredoxin-like domain-containing protein [Echria macrotheca]
MAAKEYTLVPGTLQYEFGNGDEALEFIGAHEAVLMVVLHPVAPNWHRFASVYDQLARTLDATGTGIKCARLDISDGDAVVELCHKMRIPRVPTLFLFNGPGTFRRYNGPLRERDVLAFLRRQKLPSVTVVESADALQALKDENDVLVAAFLDAGESTLRRQFETVADELKDEFVFTVSTDKAVAEAEGLASPSVVVFKKVADERTVLVSKAWKDEGALRSFIATAIEPVVPELHWETYNDFVEDRETSVGYLFLPTPEATKAASLALLPLARTHKSTITFTVINGPAFPRLVDDMHLPEAVFPAFVLHDLSQNLKYPLLPNPWPPLSTPSLEDISTHVDRYLIGALEPALKSAPIPEPSDSPLVEVVGHTYREIVLNNNRDVVVEYSRDDCAGCDALAPQWRKLAELAAGEQDRLTVATMNFDHNDALDKDIRGFPSIKMYPAGRKDKPVAYNAEQGHGLQKWAKFIQEAGTHGVQISV